MGMSNAFKAQILDHILNNAAIPNVGDAGGLQPSVADGDLFVALHTADPGAGGTQATSETTYTGGYARQPVSRDGTDWTAPGATSTNVGAVTFAAPTNVVGQVITHFSLGVAVAGATVYITAAALAVPYLAILGAPAPSFPIGDLLARAIPA